MSSPVCPFGPCHHRTMVPRLSNRIHVQISIDERDGITSGDSVWKSYVGIYNYAIIVFGIH